MLVPGCSCDGALVVVIVVLVVMAMPMGVLDGRVVVFVFMRLDPQQAECCRHENHRQRVFDPDVFAEDEPRDPEAEQGSCRKVQLGSCCAELLRTRGVQHQ